MSELKEVFDKKMIELKEVFDKAHCGFTVHTTDGVMVYKVADFINNAFVSCEYTIEDYELIRGEDYKSLVLPIKEINHIHHAQLWSDSHKHLVWVPLRDL